MKNFIIKLVLFSLILTFSLFDQKCFALEPCKDTIKVGISNNNFSKLEYKKIVISAETSYSAFQNDKLILTSSAYHPLEIKSSDNNFLLIHAGKIYKVENTSPIQIKPTKKGLLYIPGLNRKSKQAKYRGYFEIKKVYNNKFNLINVINVTDYLKGVVPNEMPIRFGLEALKAQAIAARNYVFRPRTKKFHNFDVCDSVQSQVYFGANTEQSLASKAIEETKGLYSIYDNEVTLALYSSTAGGHTENYENAFSSTDTSDFPSNPIPYLKGVADFPSNIDLTIEKNAKAFYTSQPQSFDVLSPHYRWIKKWSRKDLEKILDKNLKKFSKTGFVKPILLKNQTIGTIKNIEVLKRGASGKAMYIKITTTNGEWLIAKELVIRRIFEINRRILPSANVIFEFERDQESEINYILAKGGGLGHGVGMSQYGAWFMAKRGDTFDKIIQHYYSNVSIGTKPKEVNLGETCESNFVSPNGLGTLIINNKDKIKGIVITTNNSTICLSDEILDNNEIRINLNDFVKKGLNKLKICVKNKPEETVEGKIKYWVEIYGSRNEK